MINPYSPGTRTAFGPEKHSHSPLALSPPTLSSVTQGRAALHTHGGWRMLQKGKLRNSNGKREMLSSPQAQRGRPVPSKWPRSTHITSRGKKKTFFFPIPNHGFICLTLQVFLKYEYVKCYFLQCLHTCVIYMTSLHVFGLGICITQRLGTQTVWILFLQDSTCPKMPHDWQKARSVKFKASLYLCRGKRGCLWRQLYWVLYLYPEKSLNTKKPGQKQKNKNNKKKVNSE